MKVILQQDVSGQGKRGDLVSVSDGYARNYLMPRKLAVEATPEALNEYKQREKNKSDRLAKEKQDALQAAERLKTCNVVVEAKSGAGGRLFGAVTTAEIAAALKEQFGVEMDKKSFVMPDPIKQHGTYELKCKLGYEVSAILKVEVKPAGE